MSSKETNTSVNTIATYVRLIFLNNIMLEIFQMVIKLYTTELSPPVRASIMAFEIFQVPYENIEVNLSDKSIEDPEFLNVRQF